MDRETILARVRKILAKVGRGATEGEAASAMAMAAKILADHNLEMADVGSGPSEWGEGVCFEGTRCPSEIMAIAPILEGFFFVRCYSSRQWGRVTGIVFGDSASVEVAVWVFGRLRDQYRDLFRSFRIRTGAPLASRHGYYIGLKDGLMLRLRDERRADEANSSTAGSSRELATVAADRRVEDAFAAAKPDCGPPKIKAVRTGGEYGHGVSDSAKVSLARPLDGPVRGPIAITGPAEALS